MLQRPQEREHRTDPGGTSKDGAVLGTATGDSKSGVLAPDIGWTLREEPVQEQSGGASVG